jgi:hypothetical protein
MRGKVTRRGTMGGYEVTGWRGLRNASWHANGRLDCGRPEGATMPARMHPWATAVLIMRRLRCHCHKTFIKSKSSVNSP